MHGAFGLSPCRVKNKRPEAGSDLSFTALLRNDAFGAKAKLCAPRFVHKAGTWGFVQATQASQRQAGKRGSGAGR